MDLVLSYIEKEKVQSANSGVLYYDLPKNEQISCLVVEFKATKTSTVDHTNPIFDQVSKIEVMLDGSKTAFSASPYVGSIFAFEAAGKIPPHEPRERGVATICLPIFFGRFPGDEEYGLDTGLYKSGCQLQITYNTDTTDWATGTTTTTVYYLRPVERANWRGFVRQRTIHTLTSSGSAGSEIVDLPNGLPWLRVGFRNFDIDQYIYNDITDLDLSVDDGRLHLFQGRIEDAITLERMRLQGIVKSYGVDMTAKDGEYPQTYLALMRDLEICGFSASPRMYAFSSWLGHRFELKMSSADGTVVTAAETIQYRAGGYCLHGNITLADFSKRPFPAPQHSDCKIEYTMGAYTSVTETWVQELVEGML